MWEESIAKFSATYLFSLVFLLLSLPSPSKCNTDSGLATLNGGVNIVSYIKAQRLRWFGHIQRMEDDRMVRKRTNWQPFGKRSAGRPKNRWTDGILKDVEVLKVKNWKELIGNRKEFNNLVEKAKTHAGL
jgi:hypothetical protein